MAKKSSIANRAKQFEEYYGGRGIEICDRWREDFRNFLEDMGECLNGMSIDRIDIDGDYCPENCRWATPYDQNRNMRTNVWVELDGERMIITDVIRMLGIVVGTFYYMKSRRLNHQETIDYYVGIANG